MAGASLRDSIITSDESISQLRTASNAPFDASNAPFDASFSRALLVQLTPTSIHYQSTIAQRKRNNRLRQIALQIDNDYEQDGYASRRDQ